MDAAELIESIDEWPADDVRGFLDRHHPDDYQLIDVRQRQQHEARRLPGAVCIPAEELPTRLGELSREKPTIVYCQRGTLSRAAAQLLVRSGFEDVRILLGGFHAWQQGVSSGSPRRLYAPLVNADSAEEQAALAWSMEEAARRFYEAMAARLDEPGVVALFTELAETEARHKNTLEAVWEALAGCPAVEGFAALPVAENWVMEGGKALDEALLWAEGSGAEEILDFAMAMELNAYDHYLSLQRDADDPDSKRLFEVMADEERHHLRQLGTSLARIREL